MTTITDQMIRIGTLQGVTWLTTIYQDGSEFFYQTEGWGVNSEKESSRFSSLDRLLAPFPRGIHFQKDGETESREDYLKRVKKLTPLFEEQERRMHEIDEERLREFGTTDYQEITKIIEPRKKNGTYVPPPPKKQPDPEQMVKIGILQGQSGKGTIYQDGPDFLYLSSGWTQSEIDDGIYIDEKSERFPTLNTLLATIPRGIEYHPEEK